MARTFLPFRHFSAEAVAWAAPIHRLRRERRGSPLRPYARSVTVTAYGDESIRRSGVPEPVYLLGAYVPAEDGEALTDALAGFEHRGKLHWRDAKPRDKRAIDRVIGRHVGVHVVVAAAPLVGGVREERARQQALASLLVILEQEHGVQRLVLERRQYAQDMKDVATAKALRVGAALMGDFELAHVHGAVDPHLWVPDQVLGAYGDALAGDCRAWDMLAHRVQVERLNLS